MTKIVLKIDGMHCDACAKRLENVLNRKDEVKSAKVDFNTKKAEVEFENSTKEKIEEYIETAGFKSLGE